MGIHRRGTQTGRFSAGGEPWHVMLKNCERILSRLRQTKPFPLEFSTLMRTCFPIESMAATTSEAIWRNLLRSTMRGRMTHFELEGEDPSLTFWLRHESDVPVPKDMGELFQVEKDNPYFKQIGQWCYDAYHVHDEITGCTDSLQQFFKSVKHPKWAIAEWPEIEPFVGEQNPQVVAEIPKKPAKDCVYVVTPHVRRGVEETLTKCLMLPDVEIDAWVAYADIGAG